jgi:hypothetical protein
MIESAHTGILTELEWSKPLISLKHRIPHLVLIWIKEKQIIFQQPSQAKHLSKAKVGPTHKMILR